MRRALLLPAALLLFTSCSIPRWPVEGRLTSPFGIRRSGLDFSIHRGVDISVPTGTPVRAMASGRVAFAGTLRGYGTVVMVDHPRGIRTVYAHLSELRVQTGDRLDGRAVIGLSGSSGRSTGPHLHFEIETRSGAEDPVQLLGGKPPERNP
jgi:murein DD-endopeptidase MepM/ murein hydrolase activator NlpD